MRFFLGSFTSFIFITLIFLFWLVGFYWFSIPLLLVYGMILFFSRKLPPAFQEDGALKEGILFSPVNGKVTAVNESFNHDVYGENTKEIVLVSAWWREHGIYFPTKAEVNNLSYVGHRGHFRFFSHKVFQKNQKREPSVTMGMSCAHSNSFGIDFYKCPLGFWPKILTIPGDRGKAQVNMGFFGLGGTTVLYLPAEYEVTVNVGTEVIAGQTILARSTEVIKAD